MMSTETHLSEQDVQRPDSGRPSVTSKCLSNLRSIVSHNVSMNNHHQHEAIVDKPNPAHPPVASRPARLMELALLPVNSSNGVGVENHRRKPRQSFPMANTHVERSENEVVRNTLSPSKKRSHGNHQNATIPIDTSSVFTPSQVQHDENKTEDPAKKNPNKSQPSITGRISSGNGATFKHKGLSIGLSLPLRFNMHPAGPKPVAHDFPPSSVKSSYYRPTFVESSEAKPIELPIYRHDSSSPSLSGIDTDRNSTSDSLNKSIDSCTSTTSIQSPVGGRSPRGFRPPRPPMHTQQQFASHNFGQYTRLPQQLRNPNPPFQPTLPSQPIRPPRRSYPSSAERQQESTSRIPAEVYNCCQSESSSSTKERHTTRRRATQGNHPQQPTTTEKNLLDSEARSNYFRQVEGTREIMLNVAKRLTQDLPSSMAVPIVDTHCHFDLIFDRLRIKHNDLTRYFRDYSEFYPSGLSFELAIQVFWRPQHLTEENWNDWYSRYLDDDRVYGSCGIHPHWSASWSDTCIEDIERCLTHPKVVAIGEIGLDFGPKNECKMHVQCRAFEEQLKIAARWFKPIVIHSRDAYQETFQLMKQYLQPDHKIHLHCFVGTLNDVDLFTSYFTEIKFGFTPLVSRSKFLHPVLQQLELTQILSETDSPYFMPDELSKVSRLAHPGMVYSVIETISKLRYLTVIDVARQLRENARHIYGV